MSRPVDPVRRRSLSVISGRAYPTSHSRRSSNRSIESMTTGAAREGGVGLGLSITRRKVALTVRDPHRKRQTGSHGHYQAAGGVRQRTRAPAPDSKVRRRNRPADVNLAPEVRDLFRVSAGEEASHARQPAERFASAGQINNQADRHPRTWE